MPRFIPPAEPIAVAHKSRIGNPASILSFIVSLMVHVGLILLLAVIVIVPQVIENGWITASVSQDDGLANELAVVDIEEQLASDSLSISDASVAEELVDLPTMDRLDTIEVDMTIPPSKSVVDLQSDNKAAEWLSPKNAKSPSSKKKVPTKAKSASAVSRHIASAKPPSQKGLSSLLTQPSEGVQLSNTTTEAAMNAFGRLEAGAKGNELFSIVWLMDSSMSLYAERQQLAPVVEKFYSQFESEKYKNKLRTDIYAFGNQVVHVGQDRNVPNGRAVANAIANVPIDSTGLENVMNAVAYCVNDIRTHSKRSAMELVIWTDESGDDTALLEDVIVLCRTNNVKVHVIGPVSVLGAERGLQAHKLPRPWGYSVFLPVKRGPDSAFIEKAWLPMWHESSRVRWGHESIIPATDLVKSGGPHRSTLLGSTGPYALVRLALATGGTYTAFRREGDLAFDLGDRLPDYLPDYRSGWEIAADIEQYPLRKAVVEASALTAMHMYWPPAVEFPSASATTFPFANTPTYRPAKDFVKLLKVQIPTETERLKPVRMAIERAIYIMMQLPPSESYSSVLDEESQVNVGLADAKFQSPEAYLQEKSKRWRAWYDLNLGRLLAHSVRIEAYYATVSQLTSPIATEQMLASDINHIVLFPAMLSTPNSEWEQRSRIARLLLERVIQDHPQSAWSELAKAELASPFGVRFDMRVIPKPPPSPPPNPFRSSSPSPSSSPTLPRPTLPNL